MADSPVEGNGSPRHFQSHLRFPSEHHFTLEEKINSSWQIKLSDWDGFQPTRSEMHSFCTADTPAYNVPHQVHMM